MTYTFIHLLLQLLPLGVANGSSASISPHHLYPILSSLLCISSFATYIWTISVVFLFSFCLAAPSLRSFLQYTPCPSSSYIHTISSFSLTFPPNYWTWAVLFCSFQLFISNPAPPGPNRNRSIVLLIFIEKDILLKKGTLHIIQQKILCNTS